MRHLSRLYPRRWRQRYGSEFEALIEDLPTTPGNLVDVAAGAVRAHLAESRRYAAALVVLVSVILIIQLVQLIVLMGASLLLTMNGHSLNFDLRLGSVDFYYARSTGRSFEVGLGVGTAAIAVLFALTAGACRARFAR